jgi:hypothetical protein
VVAVSMQPRLSCVVLAVLKIVMLSLALADPGQAVLLLSRTVTLVEAPVQPARIDSGSICSL